MAAIVFGLLGLATWVRDRGARPNPELFRPAERSLANAANARPGIPAAELLLVKTVEPREDSGEVSYSLQSTAYSLSAGGARAAGQSGADVASLLDAGLCGPGWQQDGEVETFGPDNLYEKIDGREGLYKSYNFRQLWTASYDSTAPPAARFDVEVFLQGSPLDAYGVLSTERQGMVRTEATTSARTEAKPASAAPDRTVTPNGLYFLAGAHYVRLLGSEASPRVDAALAAAAAKLAGLAPATASATPSTAASSPAGTAPGEASGPLLPPGRLDSPESWSPAANPLLSLGADPATLQYLAQDGLGQEYFKGLYLATLPAGKGRVTAFLFPAPDAAAAKSVFERYRTFLATQGKPATPAQLAGAPAGSVAVEIAMLDTWEWAFLAGRYVAGVTEAEDPDTARAACALLGKALGAASQAAR
jgi:hypothetical protein